MYDDFMDFVKDIVLPVFMVVFAVMIFVVVVTSIPAYYASCRESVVFNKLNNTDFTCSDFFWASNQINSNTQTIKLK